MFYGYKLPGGKAHVINLFYYPTMMKLGTVIPYPKKIKKIMNHVTRVLSSADISIFSPEISKFCYIKKCRHKLYFDI